MSRIRAEHPHRYALALGGQVAAEALTTADRGRLLWALYGGGMSVEEIAAHTRSTQYTVDRILRERPRHGRCEQQPGIGGGQPPTRGVA